jgi:acetylglutamate kinase
MVYGGLVNKQNRRKTAAMGCNALGVTGADGNMISATKRPVKDIDFGFVGDIRPKGSTTRCFISY